MAPLTATDMPEWTERAGGRARWADWLERKINPLKRRAREWKENRGNSGPVESAVEWRAALKRAVHASKGRGHYSRLPLTLLHAQGNTAAMCPRSSTRRLLQTRS